MTTKKIPLHIKTSVLKAVEEFNLEKFEDWEIAFRATFQGRYVYLSRKAFSFPSNKICRLTFTGDPMAWEFAIYEYSTEQYSPEERFFPGAEEVDGSIEGALRAGMLAYPV